MVLEEKFSIVRLVDTVTKSTFRSKLFLENKDAISVIAIYFITPQIWEEQLIT